MTYQAVILALHDDIEEEVLLRISEVQLNCFASICPHEIREGEQYPVCLELLVLGDYHLTEWPLPSTPAFCRIGNGFSYDVCGKLSGKFLEAGGLVFEDEVFQRDFSFLNGKLVRLRVDRIDVEFILMTVDGLPG